MSSTAVDFAAHKARAIVLTPDGEPIFNKQDKEALARHIKVMSYTHRYWREADGALTARAVMEIGRNLAACKRIAKGAFKDWYEYIGGMPGEAECKINAYELCLEHNAILDLPGRAILLLFCPVTPEAARTKIIQRVEAGEKLTEKRVEAIVRKANGGRKIDLGFW
jgi:hypothetical protein